MVYCSTVLHIGTIRASHDRILSDIVTGGKSRGLLTKSPGRADELNYTSLRDPNSMQVVFLMRRVEMISVEVLKKMVPTIAPVMTAWAENMERLAMEKGVALDSLQWGDALRAGVQRPERVRIMNVDDIPLPNPELTFLARETGIITDTTDGLTFGHGIFLKNNLPDAKRRLIHQLVHCSQYERLGEMRQFIREYVQCCLDFGYAQSPYELEAEARTQEILADFHIGTMTCGSEQ